MGEGGGKLAGRRTFVAASSQGLGRVIALDLAGRGTWVAVNGRASEGTAAVAAEIGGRGGPSVACPADRAEAGGPERVVVQAAEAMGASTWS